VTVFFKNTKYDKSKQRLTYTGNELMFSLEGITP